MNPKPGEVWIADLGLAAKTRPVLIVSRFDPDPPRALAIYIPFTRASRGSAYEISVGKPPFLHDESVLNVQGIGSLPFARLERLIGRLPPATLEQVKHALRYAMEL